jgi:hypothetical protein
MLKLISHARERLLDTADLLIDFMTLGEYGLQEPAPRAMPQAAATAEPARTSRLAA